MPVNRKVQLAERKRLRTLNDYVDITPEMSLVIGQAWAEAENKDDGSGQVFINLVDSLFDKFATQTY